MLRSTPRLEFSSVPRNTTERYLYKCTPVYTMLVVFLRADWQHLSTVIDGGIPVQYLVQELRTRMHNIDIGYRIPKQFESHIIDLTDAAERFFCIAHTLVMVVGEIVISSDERVSHLS